MSVESCASAELPPLDFLQKFKGKANRIPRLGINALLLREEFADFDTPLPAPKGSAPRPLFDPDAPLLKRPLPPPPAHPAKLPPKTTIQPSAPSEEGSSLRRNPSERLPTIFHSQQLCRKPSAGVLTPL